MMVPLREPDTELTLGELAEQVRVLTAALATLAERQASVEGRLPPVALPDNWISVKAASAISNYSEPALYRFCRLGIVDSRPVGGRVAIDSGTLARRLAEHLARRKKIK